MQITLLRHAPTAGNLCKRYIGKTDEPITDQSAKLLQKAPKYKDVKLVYTSALTRTIQTANILFPHADTIQVPQFNEMDFGVFEGKNWQDLQVDENYNQWLQTNCEGQCPKGESKEAFTRRCCSAFIHLCSTAPQKEIFIVAHGGTIMAVLSQLALPSKSYYDWSTPHCNGFSLLYTPSNPRPLQVLSSLSVIP